MKYLFGYLLAKAIETEYSETHKRDIFHKKLLVSYTPMDARAGKITTLLDEKRHQTIVEAMKLGGQFYQDFAFWYPPDEEQNVSYDEDLMKALVAVQQLGEIYAAKVME